MRAGPEAAPRAGIVLRPGPVSDAARAACRTLSPALLCLIVYAGLAGSRNPETNIVPTLVWLAWWVGLPLATACLGNIWPALDPWRALFDAFHGLARRAGLARVSAPARAWPRALGAWPAVALLLSFAWLEVVYPYAALPAHIAWMAIAWSAFTWAGMACFGADAWQRHADVFAVYFDTLGRFAPLGPGPGEHCVVLRPPGRALIAGEAGSLAMVAFVIAMLSTLLFDGLTGTPSFAWVHRALARWAPRWI